MKPSSSGVGSRANALWGRGGRHGSRGRVRPVAGGVAVLAAVAAFALPAAGVAASSGAGTPGSAVAASNGGAAVGSAVSVLANAFGVSSHNSAGLPHVGGANGPVIPASLLKQVQSNPKQSFNLILQGKLGSVAALTRALHAVGTARTGKPFRSIPGLNVTISGKDLLRVAQKWPNLLSAITVNQTMKTADYQDGTMWPSSADVAPLWNSYDPNTGDVTGPAPQAPAIAFIDSGVDAADTTDFGSRVVASADFCSLCTDTGSGNDLEGHGTMVAGVAAGSGPDYPGVAQNAPIVSVRVADANGESMESDVIAAADWVLANKDTYGIKVVNISMAGSSPTSFQFDPLDQAVERLWFSGVTVVVAAGNFGDGAPVDMSAAPGNDPFVITVGALDQNQTMDPSDDTVTPWSAYGFTADGFSKPDIAAPGRYMVMPAPNTDATIPQTVPDRIVAPGYMWMSGTSFAAPVVSGSAAQILALHPDWTPDEVKGALMLTAAYLPNADWQAAGAGEVDAASAASLPFDPPNPNENLDTFVGTDPSTGQPTFDAAAWASAVSSDAAWSSAAWSSAAWASAAWASAAWASAAWSSAAWSSAAWSSAMSTAFSYSEATFSP
jgi:serine protease AprX